MKQALLFLWWFYYKNNEDDDDDENDADDDDNIATNDVIAEWRMRIIMMTKKMTKMIETTQPDLLRLCEVFTEAYLTLWQIKIMIMKMIMMVDCSNVAYWGFASFAVR